MPRLHTHQSHQSHQSQLLFRAFSIFIFFLFSTQSAFSAVPQSINYQGVLTDTNGVPLDTTVTLNIKFYDAASAGTLLYEEEHGAVTVSDGVFSVSLGSGAVQSGSFNADLFSDNTTWLELSVGGETQSPRQALNAVPYALHSETAEDASSLGGSSRAGVISQAVTDVFEILDVRCAEGEVLQVLVPQTGEKGCIANQPQMAGFDSNFFFDAGESLTVEYAGVSRNWEVLAGGEPQRANNRKPPYQFKVNDLQVRQMSIPGLPSELVLDRVIFGAVSSVSSPVMKVEVGDLYFDWPENIGTQGGFIQFPGSVSLRNKIHIKMYLADSAYGAFDSWYSGWDPITGAAGQIIDILFEFQAPHDQLIYEFGQCRPLKLLSASNMPSGSEQGTALIECETVLHFQQHWDTAFSDYVEKVLNNEIGVDPNTLLPEIETTWHYTDGQGGNHTEEINYGNAMLKRLSFPPFNTTLTSGEAVQEMDFQPQTTDALLPLDQF